MKKPEGFDVSGYFPGVIGKVTELHGVYYHRNWGFDRSFEIQVGRELADFMEHFREERDGFWAARFGDTFAGCIALDARLAKSEGARIRWFIVDPRCQGRGLGSFLLRQAIAWCSLQKEIRKIFLWTFSGLDTARRLYERKGFRLAEEKNLRHWGAALKEQKFERPVDS